jgi:hypothetical protein
MTLNVTAVAYVKYDRASSAAAAQEHLHETVLSDGRTKLKVMLAEAPHSRWFRACLLQTMLSRFTEGTGSKAGCRDIHLQPPQRA